MPTRPSPRPFVLVNMSMSADGKIASTDRRFNSFGSRQDENNLYRLRASVDAILCGARTASVPGVSLDAGAPRFIGMRQRRGLAAQPLRIIASGMARLALDAPVLDGSLPRPILLVSRAAPAKSVRDLRARGAEVVAFGRKQLDLVAALQWLRREHGVRRLVCEGGGELNDAMFRASLVDEVHLTVCPVLIGGRGAPTVADGTGVARLVRATRLRFKTVRKRGQELFLVLSVVGS